jgi:lipopolysaccharide/colanic/teichoic acid biosynthesis glycosyltransferase
VESFSKSIRLSDFLGWHSEDKLGLILPEANENGAHIVLDRLKTHFNNMRRCNLYQLIEQNGMFSIAEYPKMLRENGVLQSITESKPDDGKHGLPGNRASSPCFFHSRFFDETSLCSALRAQSPSLKVDSLARRCLDIFASLIGLILTFPIWILISVLIKLTSRGPVLFKQERLGQRGKEFTFLKFRTMYHNCDQTIHKRYVKVLIENKAEKYEHNGCGYYKLTQDPRVTAFGRFLRITSLDELPQLINVLMGDMSLVGPRPPIGYEVENYQNWQLRRILEVKPGITGLWQVDGRSTTTFDDMVRLDLKYVEKQSLMLNFVILLKTFKAVLSMKGAY